MQPNIHPEGHDIKVTCSCSNTFQIHTLSDQDMHVEVCYKCHPAYTGKRRVAKAGAIDRFAQKYEMFSSMTSSSGTHDDKPN